MTIWRNTVSRVAEEAEAQGEDGAWGVRDAAGGRVTSPEIRGEQEKAVKSQGYGGDQRDQHVLPLSNVD